MTTRENSLVASLPDPVRRPLRLMMELVAIVGALSAVVGWFASFISFLERMQFWPMVWRELVGWLAGLSSIAHQIAEAIGAGAHWLAELYRALIYPLFDFLLGWTSFRVPEWGYDAIFIGSFVILSYVRYWRTPTTSKSGLLAEFGEYVLKSGPFMPLSALNYVGTLAFAWVLQPLYRMMMPAMRSFELAQLKAEVEQLRKGNGVLRLALARLRAEGSRFRLIFTYLLIFVVDALSMSMVLWLPLLVEAIYIWWRAQSFA